MIADIERILDEVVFIDKGEIALVSSADELGIKLNYQLMKNLGGYSNAKEVIKI